MSEFKKSQWSDSKYSKNYRDDANIYLPYRKQFIQVTKLFYKQYIPSNTKVKVLDLGCGDGFFINELLKSFAPEEIVLVDGSSEMLENAKARLIEHTNINFINATFQDLLTNDQLAGTYDFVFSSLAIHHLNSVEKEDLYKYIYSHLSPNGYFINYDVVLPSSEKLENVYLLLWSKWIKENSEKETNEKLKGIPEQYKENSDNVPDSLESQLEVLKKIGFKNVECYFKYGIFSLFGGNKQSE